MVCLSRNSYCSEHPWSISKYDPERHSIFALQDEPAEEEEGVNEVQELGAVYNQELGPVDGQELEAVDEQELESVNKREQRPVDGGKESMDEPVEQGPVDEPVEQGPVDEPVELELEQMNGSIRRGQVLDSSDCHASSQSTFRTNELVPGVTHLPSNTKSKTPALPQRQGNNKSSSMASGRGSFAAPGLGRGRMERKVDHAKRGIAPKASGGPRVRTFLLCGRNAAPMYVCRWHVCLFMCEILRACTCTSLLAVHLTVCTVFHCLWYLCPLQSGAALDKQGLEKARRQPIAVLHTPMGRVQAAYRLPELQGRTTDCQPLPQHQPPHNKEWSS